MYKFNIPSNLNETDQVNETIDRENIQMLS